MVACAYEVSNGTGKMNLDIGAVLHDGYITMTQPSSPPPTSGNEIYVMDLPIESPFPPDGSVVFPEEIYSVFFNGYSPGGGTRQVFIDLSSPNQIPEVSSYQFRYRFRVTPVLPSPQLNSYNSVKVHHDFFFFIGDLYTRDENVSVISESDRLYWRIAITTQGTDRYIEYTSTNTGSGITAGDGTTDVEYGFTFVTNAWYFLVFDVDKEITRFKLYREGTSEPSLWDATIGTGVDDLPSTMRIDFQTAYGVVPATEASFEVDYIDLMDSGVTNPTLVGDTTLVSVIGRVTQIFNGVGQTFRLDNGYVTGSTEVYIGGTLQRPDTDYTESDPTAGEITLGTPTPETITVVYTSVVQTGPPNTGVISPSPSGTVATLSPGDSLQSVINNTDIGTIILTPGNYSPGDIVLPSRATNNALLIQAQNRHAAIINNGQWLFGGAGGFTPSANIVLDGLSFQNHTVADTGIIIFGYGNVTNCTILNLDMRNNVNSAPPQQSHHIYMTRGSHYNITIDGYTCVGPGSAMTGFHAYHNEDGPRQFITLRNFDFSNLYCGILDWQTMTNLLIEDGYVRSSGQGVDISDSPSGIIRRVTTIGVGSNSIGSGMTQDSNSF